jgi:hypothetical protein
MRHARFILAVVFATPFIAFAQRPSNFTEVVYWVADFVGLLIPVIVAITFLYVLWGMARYWIINGGNEENIAQGKWVLITGVIGLTVIVGMWGLVSLVRNAIFF